MTHARARAMMYDHAAGTLRPADKARLLDHLGRCRECSDHLQRMETAIRLLSAPSTRPSDRLAPEYWKTFANSVELRLRAERPSRSSVLSKVVDAAEQMIMTHKPLVATAGGLLTVVVVLSFFLRVPAEAPKIAGTATVEETRPKAATPDVRQYLRRSRALFVGLENMRTPDRQVLDLGPERKVSRELLQETRALQLEPMDLHTARLVGDMEKILIEIANADEQAGKHDLEIIRGGIRQENLLFKLRMAETAFLHTASMRKESP